MSGDKVFLDVAAESGELLLNASKVNSSGRFWPTETAPDGLKGLVGGSAGIAIFLAQIFADGGGSEYESASIEAADMVINSADESNGKYVWFPSAAKTIHTPYQHSGAAGICSALCRVYAITGYERARQWASIAADTSFARTCVNCGHMNGISGIGEAMLDCFHVTRDQKYLDRACQVAESVFSYLIREPNGLAVPGARNERLQDNYSGGAAGVGSFLLRLNRLAGRRFMDLPEDFDKPLPEPRKLIQ